MNFFSGHSKLMAFLSALVLVSVGFQNCSPVSFSSTSKDLVDDLGTGACASDPTQCPPAPTTCTFNGVSYNEGRSIIAYLTSTVPNGQTCTSEIRLCVKGSFTGSYTYATCAVGGPAACLFNGQTIAHGSTVKAYQNSSVASGQTCTSEDRTCNNGTLSGSYNYASCSVGTATSCLFNGQTIANGGSVVAYPSASVPFGQSCQGNTRVCTNGILSGSGDHASCTVGGAASCLFNNQTIPHGGSVPAFLNSSVAYGQTCTKETRVCNNGALSGSYSYASCTSGTAASCLFNGQSVAHGEKVKAYQSSAVSFGQSCVSQDRVCTNGTLSGNYTFASCSVGAAASCLFNGQTIVSGGSVYAFQSSSVAYNQACSAELRTCTNGVLNGSYTFATCSQGTPASCTFNNQTIAHGQEVMAYATSSVGYGQTCAQQKRICNNGSLSGSYTFASCGANPGVSCNFNGQIIGHGGTVVAYATPSVAPGKTCAQENRTCNNGILSGSFGHNSCTAPYVTHIEPYCDGIGCVAGCGTWERGEKVFYSDGSYVKQNFETGGANDCGP